MRLEVSIDDGYPLDLYIAQKLSELNVRATFYVPAKNIEGLPTLTQQELRQIAQLGHEIGGHTYNHRYLNNLTDNLAIQEIRSGIEYIQDVTSCEVKNFCLPGGKFPKNIAILDQFSFQKIRTTRNMNFDNMNRIFDPSYQFYPHSKYGIFVNATKQLRVSRLIHASRYCRIRDNNNLPDMSKNPQFLKNKKVIHVWCHSWELEKLGLIDKFLTHIKVLANYENYYT